MINKEKIKAFTELVNAEIISPNEFAKIIKILSDDTLEIDDCDISEGFTIENIKKTVGDYFNLTSEQLESRNRSSSVAKARQMAFYICNKYTNESLGNIGQAFGGREHSVVIHSVNKIEEAIQTDEHEKNLVLRIIERIERNQDA